VTAVPEDGLHMEWGLWDRDWNVVTVVTIPEERDPPDVIVYQNRIFYYDSKNGGFLEADVWGAPAGAKNG
jgi:hypothetical protein